MLDKKEIIPVLVVTVILALAFNMRNFSSAIFFWTFVTIFLVLVINIIAKQIASFYLDSEIETKLWDVRRFGFKTHHYLKKPFPAGIFLPIITAALSFGYLIWMACLIFNVKPRVYRTAKRHGLYSFSEMTESHIGLIAASGIFANLILAVIGYFLGFELFTKLNIYYAFFNMLPLSDLDGNKIFFGNLILWSFLASLVLIALAYALLVV